MNSTSMGGVQDGGGLVAGVGVGVDDEGLGDDDLGPWGLAGDPGALGDEGGGLAGGDRDRSGAAAGGGVLLGLGGSAEAGEVARVLRQPVLVFLC